ncbi:MAG: rRNA maturation RNase YbeY [Cyclobacteriaceae bacterium]
MPIFLHNEDRSHFLDDVTITIHWLQMVAQQENHTIGDLNFIFCSDDYLLEINKNYLNHDYYTDVITFDHSERDNEIAGDIFISIDRIKDYSDDNGINEIIELHRIMVHGLLHLLGYLDKSEKDKIRMTRTEDDYLLLFNK